MYLEIIMVILETMADSRKKELCLGRDLSRMSSLLLPFYVVGAGETGRGIHLFHSERKNGFDEDNLLLLRC